MKAPRFWRIADAADLAWRRWEDEYVFHHALANDTHRLSGPAGIVLTQLLHSGEMEEATLADTCGLDEQELEVILQELAKIDFLTWR